MRNLAAAPERDCAASQSQQREKGKALENPNRTKAGTLLRLVCDTAALPKKDAGARLQPLCWASREIL